jgi:hypothetical protein
MGSLFSTNNIDTAEAYRYPAGFNTLAAETRELKHNTTTGYYAFECMDKQGQWWRDTIQVHIPNEAVATGESDSESVATTRFNTTFLKNYVQCVRHRTFYFPFTKYQLPRQHNFRRETIRFYRRETDVAVRYLGPYLTLESVPCPFHHLCNDPDLQHLDKPLVGQTCHCTRCCESSDGEENVGPPPPLH